MENFKEDQKILSSIIENNTSLKAITAADTDLALEMFEVEMFKTKKFSTPEIIVIDVILPGKDGFELASAFSKRDDTKHIPVLFIVSANDINNKKKIFKFGGRDYIEKPFVMEEVLTRIDVQLNYKKMKDELLIKNELLEDNEKLLVSRGKEVKGLLELLKVLDSDISADEALQTITRRIIPDYLQYPDRTYCEIEVDKKVYSNFTNVYSSNNFSLIVPIRWGGAERGSLKVGYEKNEGKLLSNFEKRMMAIYAFNIAHLMERREVMRTRDRNSSVITATLDAYRDGILIMSNTGELQYNDRFIDIWGLSKEILTSYNSKKLLSEMRNKMSDPDKFDGIIKHDETNKDGRHGLIPFKDGRSFILNTKTIQSQGDTVFYVWNFHDVTLEVKLKKEIQSLKEKNNQIENLLNKRNL